MVIRVPNRWDFSGLVDPGVPRESARFRIVIHKPFSRSRIETHKPLAVQYSAPDFAILVRHRLVELRIREIWRRRQKCAHRNALVLVDFVHHLDENTVSAAVPGIPERIEASPRSAMGKIA